MPLFQGHLRAGFGTSKAPQSSQILALVVGFWLEVVSRIGLKFPGVQRIPLF